MFDWMIWLRSKENDVEQIGWIESWKELEENPTLKYCE